jgi:hypothetical protein
MALSTSQTRIFTNLQDNKPADFIKSRKCFDEPSNSQFNLGLPHEMNGSII